MTMDANALRDRAREKLIADMKIVVDDAEVLLKVSTDQAGEGYAAAKERRASRRCVQALRGRAHRCRRR